MEGTMNKTLKQTLYWTPRIAGILFILFLSLFALDIFDMKLGFWGTVVGLFMHLIPSIVLAIAIIFAWRREWIGALLFIGWGVFYVTGFRGFNWIAYVMIAGIPFIIGILFLVDWIYRKELHAV
jgi:hypothetical protein